MKSVANTSWKIAVLFHDPRHRLTPLGTEVQDHLRSFGHEITAHHIQQDRDFANLLRNIQTDYVLVWNLETPVQLDFLTRALKLIEQPTQRIVLRANRRLNASEFLVSPNTLRLVHRRHRLGLLYNRFVRRSLPLSTTDFQSGTFLMDSHFARSAAPLLDSPLSAAQTEIHLLASIWNWPQYDLPVVLHLDHEKTSRRLVFETLELVREHAQIVRRFQRGDYNRPISLQMTPKITADDWGFTPAVNQGILELAQKGIVRRVSVLVDSGFVSSSLSKLAAIPEIQIGLHLNLTHNNLAHSPRNLLAKALRRQLKPEAIQQEVRRQWSLLCTFLRSYGIQPTYVDGHHHCHTFPGISKHVAQELKKLGISQTRLPYDPALWISPKWVINVFALFARRHFLKCGLSFLPVYYPKPSEMSSPMNLQAQLRRRPSSEVIVHPASSDDFAEAGVQDPYTLGRVTEFETLKSLNTEIGFESVN